jgi:hypothetical protein
VIVTFSAADGGLVGGIDVSVGDVTGAEVAGGDVATGGTTSGAVATGVAVEAQPARMKLAVRKIQSIAKILCFMVLHSPF